MVFFTKATAVLAGLIALASAVPGPASRGQGSFSIQQVVKKLEQPKQVNPARDYAKALRKFGASVPVHVEAAAKRGSVIATPEPNDEEYLCPVDIGGTILNLDLDTGSADLWVYSSQLPAAERAGHAVYKTNQSNRLPGFTWEIHYGDGSSAGGDVYLDYVTVGSITASQQAVEAAQHVSAEFVRDTRDDGLLGLAFDSINTVQPIPQLTWFDNVKASLDAPLFAADLKHHRPGSFDFGYINQSKYTGELTYTSVDKSQGFWGFTFDGYAVGSGSNVTRANISAVADTGTSLLLLGTKMVEAYYSKVQGAKNSFVAGGWIVPCNAHLPDFTAVINGYHAVVPGSYIMYAPADSANITCFGGIQDDAAIGFAIFGDVFLKSQYVVFDTAGPRIGFAPQT